MDPRIFALALSLMVLAVGCGDDTGPLTEIILVVDTTLDWPVEADVIEITIGSPSGDFETFDAPLDGPGVIVPPITMGLRPGGPRLEPVVVRAEAFVLGSTPVVEREVRTSFVEGQRKLLRLLLLGECITVSCAAGQTCGEGGSCQEVLVPGENLPNFTGVIPPSPDPRDICAASPSEASTTVGCNGPPLGPFVEDGAFGGRCNPAMSDSCAEGQCRSRDGVNGICLLPCAPAGRYVSTGGCPTGSRCFDLPPAPSCFPDCVMSADCTTMNCDREGSCVPPAPGTTDAGMGMADAGAPDGG